MLCSSVQHKKRCAGRHTYVHTHSSKHTTLDRGRGAQGEMPSYRFSASKHALSIQSYSMLKHTHKHSHLHTHSCAHTCLKGAETRQMLSKNGTGMKENLVWRGRELSVHTYEKEGKTRREWAGDMRSISKSKKGGGANKPSGSALSLWTACFSGQQKIS